MTRKICLKPQKWQKCLILQTSPISLRRLLMIQNNTSTNTTDPFKVYILTSLCMAFLFLINPESPEAADFPETADVPETAEVPETADVCETAEAPDFVERLDLAETSET